VLIQRESFPNDECGAQELQPDLTTCFCRRLRLHEEKQHLLQRLRDSMRIVSRLETQLKSLSSLSSPPSASSSSSLGSLSSSHASSKGSLSSLSFTDIYGLSNVAADPAMLDLHRRVDKILNNPNSPQHPNPCQQQQQQQQQRSLPESGLQSADESLMTSPVSENVPSPSNVAGNLANQQQHPPQLSLSSRSSLSSASPPVSPQVDAQGQHLQPPSYESAFMGSAERQRRLAEAKQLTERLAELGLTNVKPKLSTIVEAGKPSTEEACGLELEHLINQQYGVPSSEPLSPISEAQQARSAASDESVAGDSGVYEAASKKSKAAKAAAAETLETAQVQVKLRYAAEDALLHVGVERARNVGALSPPQGRKM